MGEHQLAPHVYSALKTVFRAHVERSFGVQKAAAGYCRVGQQAISDYVNRNTADYPAIDVVLDLAHVSGDVAVFQYCAEQLGHLLLPVPAAALNGSPLGRIGGKAMKEVGDVFQRWGAMMEDGVLSKVEGPYLRKEVREAILALVMFDLQIEEEMKRGER